MRTTVQRHHGATSVGQRNVPKKDASVKRDVFLLLLNCIKCYYLYVLDLFYLLDQFSFPIEKVSLFLPFFSYRHRHQVAWKQREMKFFCRRVDHLPYTCTIVLLWTIVKDVIHLMLPKIQFSQIPPRFFLLPPSAKVLAYAYQAPHVLFYVQAILEFFLIKSFHQPCFHLQ